MTSADFIQWLSHKSAPTMWSIAGYDASGYAGLLRDSQVAQGLGCRFYGIATCVTAQNAKEFLNLQSVDAEVLYDQLQLAWHEQKPHAVKLGALGNRAQFPVLQKWIDVFSEHGIPVVIDPVLQSSSGYDFLSPKDAADFYLRALPKATLNTPNWHELRALLEFCDITKSCNLFIKGGHIKQLAELQPLLRNTPLSQVECGPHECPDILMSSGERSEKLGPTQGILISKRSDAPGILRGSGCVLSTALAVALAKNKSIADACVFAKSFVNAFRRTCEERWNGCTSKIYAWDANEQNTPPQSHTQPSVYAPLPVSNIRMTSLDFCRFGHAKNQGMLKAKPLPNCYFGFYPIVENSEQVELMAQAGARIIQYRNKRLRDAALKCDLKRAVTLAKTLGVLLIVNDHWQWALECQAEGIHLGQTDLKTVNWNDLGKEDVYLGVSTHCLHELATTQGLNPSYIAMGPVYATTAKPMPFDPLGLAKLSALAQLTPLPKVAIGGLTCEQAPRVMAQGVQLCAVIADVWRDRDPVARARQWVHLCQEQLNHVVSHDT